MRASGLYDKLLLRILSSKHASYLWPEIKKEVSRYNYIELVEQKSGIEYS